MTIAKSDINHPIRRSIRVLEKEVKRLEFEAQNFRYVITVLEDELRDNGELSTDQKP